jgi:hypothetical protein
MLNRVQPSGAMGDFPNGMAEDRDLREDCRAGSGELLWTAEEAIRLATFNLTLRMVLL